MFGDANVGHGPFGNANAVRNVGRGAFGNANAVRNVGRGAFGNANVVQNVGRRAFGNAILNCKFEFFLTGKRTVGAVLD